MPETPYVALYLRLSLHIAEKVARAFSSAWRTNERYPLVEVVGFRKSQLNHPSCIGWTGFLSEPAERAGAESSRVPVVNYSNRNGPIKGCTNVLFDDVAMGALAADHLIEKGFRAFAYIGHPWHVYGRERAEGFRKRLAEFGHKVKIGEWDELDPARNPIEAKKDAQAWVADFLADISGPIGILAANDGIAARFFTFAKEAYPDRLPWLGVVGVDNSAVAEGGHTHGAFTSIEPPFEAMGQTIATALADAIEKRFNGTPVIRVGGARVVERATTGAPVSDDLFLARLSRRIYDEIEKGICPSVEELAVSFGVTPRAILARFSRKTDQSLRDYILLTRLRRAAILLTDTSKSIADIAYASGFSKHAALTEHFGKVYGLTPTAFRTQNQKTKNPPTGPNSRP